MVTFEKVAEFEKEIAKFFGAPYAVAVDSCTHGLELCLRHTKEKILTVPTRTYLSVAMLAEKLNLERIWVRSEWEEKYYITPRIMDAAVLWRKNSYIPKVYMCLSFQYQKHLSLGRGGMILVPTKEAYDKLKKMSYDGRDPNTPWRDQNIDTIGFHYYMTPEMAIIGLSKLDKAISTPPRVWKWEDWPDISKMKVFT